MLFLKEVKGRFAWFIFEIPLRIAFSPLMAIFSGMVGTKPYG